MKRKLTVASAVVGVLLVMSAVLILAVPAMAEKKHARNAQEVLELMLELIPAPRDTAPDGRPDVKMPAVSVNGEDFSAIIEVPLYNVKLPVYAYWDTEKSNLYPMSFAGSMYDGTLVIGGNEAQFGFTENVTGGCAVYVTDAAGERYRYYVSDAYKTRDVSSEYLMSRDADLVLFARNKLSLDYTIVLCDIG